MKKITSLLIAAAMVVTLLAGCGSSNNAPAAEAASKAQSAAAAAVSEVKEAASAAEEAATEAASAVEEAATEAASAVEEAATEAASAVEEAATEAASAVEEAAAEAPSAVNASIEDLAANAAASYAAPEGYEWPDMTLTVNDYNVPGSGPALATQLACDFIDEVTGGKIRCDVYLGGTLVEATDSFAACADGLCDVTFYLYTLNSGVSTIHQLFTNFFNREMPNMVGMLDIINDTIDTVPEFREEFTKQNLYEMVACPTGSSRLQFNSKELCESIKTPDDLKGHIVQSDGYNTTAWSNHGVSGLAMPPSEWYSNLERGVVDALAMNMPGCKDFGLFDVTNGYLEFGNNGGFMQSASGYFANLDAWNGWDPEVQELITAAFRLGVEYNCVRDDEATIANTESEKAAGKYFNTIPEEEMQPWYDMAMESINLWKEDVSAQGIDAEAVFDGYMAAVDKWFEENK